MPVLVGEQKSAGRLWPRASKPTNGGPALFHRDPPRRIGLAPAPAGRPPVAGEGPRPGRLGLTRRYTRLARAWRRPWPPPRPPARAGGQGRTGRGGDGGWEGFPLQEIPASGTRRRRHARRGGHPRGGRAVPAGRRVWGPSPFQPDGKIRVSPSETGVSARLRRGENRDSRLGAGHSDGNARSECGRRGAEPGARCWAVCRARQVPEAPEVRGAPNPRVGQGAPRR